MPLKKIRTFLTLLLGFAAFFLLISGLLLHFWPHMPNYSESHVLKSLERKSFVSRIHVAIADMDGSGDDEILVASEGQNAQDTHGDQLSFFNDLNSTPNIHNLAGKCLDMTVTDLYPERPGKEIILLEYAANQLFFEILGYAGQFIKKVPILPQINTNLQKTYGQILDVSDWNKDGKKDICIALRRSIAPFKGMGIYALSLTTGTEQTLWHFPVEEKAFVREIVDLSYAIGEKNHLFYILGFRKNRSLILFVEREGRIRWKQEIIGNAGFLHIFEFDPKSGGPEIYITALTAGFPRKSANRLYELRLEDGQILRQKPFAEPISDFIYTTHNKKPILFLLTSQGAGYCVDRNFNIIDKIPLIRGLWRNIFPVKLPNHRKPYFLLRSNLGIALLSPSFKQISLYPHRSFKRPLIYHWVPQSNPIFVIGVQARELDFVSLQINPFYYILRVYYAIVGVFGALFFLWLLTIAIPAKRERWENVIGRFLLEESALPTLIFSKKGELLRFNKKASDLLQLDLEEHRGAACEKIFLGGLEPLAQICQKFLSGDFSTNTTVLKITVAGEEMQVKMDLDFVQQLEGDSERILLVFLQDVSMLTRAEKLEAWVTMAQRIAHDIKTPLSTVGLMVQRLAMTQDDSGRNQDENFSQYISQIQEELERIRRITNNFLKFARLEKLNRAPLDLNKLIKEIVFEFEQGFPVGLKVHKKLDPSIPHVFADEEQMRVVIENILENAVEAMENGGQITVTTECVEEWDPVAHATRIFVSIEVTDTGTGIPENLLEAIQKPFFTMKKGGTGLGLAIVRESIKAHGGKVRIESKQGVGTQVVILLPALGAADTEIE